jgi:large subunit ribosomal protein L22
MIMAEIKASLYNIRMSPRKVRLVANLIKKMPAAKAKAQLSFLIKKPAPFILKLLNSAVANAKHNFQLEEDNLRVGKIVVEAGATLKRWLPRAMGRASAIHKRTCSITLWLEEIKPTAKTKRKSSRPEVLKEKEALPAVSPGKTEEIEVDEKGDRKVKEIAPAKPYGASSESKKRNFSRQTVGNLKKVFRRKSI